MNVLNYANKDKKKINYNACVKPNLSNEYIHL